MVGGGILPCDATNFALMLYLIVEYLNTKVITSKGGATEHFCLRASFSLIQFSPSNVTVEQLPEREVYSHNSLCDCGRKIRKIIDTHMPLAKDDIFSSVSVLLLVLAILSRLHDHDVTVLDFYNFIRCPGLFYLKKSLFAN